MNSNTKALPPVTHAEAREILGRFNNSHFRSCKTGETARYSIPANPARDDDLRLLQYIKQCEAAADLLAALEAELEQAQQKISGLRAINNVNGDWTLRVSRLEQDNARLREALAPLANSHTDNEGTDRPVWWILDPQQMMRACPHRLYSMFHGPFWSREEAERFFKATRYRYGSRAVVYCGSAHKSPQMRELFDCSAALAAGGDQ